MGKDVHSGRVVPDEERLPRFHLPLHKIDGMGRDLIIERLHSLSRQRSLVFSGPVSRSGNNASDFPALLEGWVPRPVGVLRVFVSVQMVEVAKELVEAMPMRQEFLAVTKMVFPELRGGVSRRLQH